MIYRKFLSILQYVCAVFFLPWTLADARRRARRRATAEQTFPDAWRTILSRGVPLYRLLPEPLRQQLEGHILIFLSEKRFEGCGGQSITSEVELTIAAQACLLLLNRETDYYPRLSTILVYPGAYFTARRTEAGPVVLEHHEVLAGESWDHDYVVLAWNEVEYGSRNATDGQNVALHEFAHQLDQENQGADGVPPLGGRGNYAAWARLLSDEYGSFCRRLSAGREQLFDEYGASSPAEFFAVVTEVFFEQPEELYRSHAELYSAFSQFYCVDPRSWLKTGLAARTSAPSRW